MKTPLAVPILSWPVLAGVAAACVLPLAPRAVAQQPTLTTTGTTTAAAQAVPVDPFVYLLGTSQAGAFTYTIKATQPVASAQKNQKVRLIAEGPNATGGRTTHLLTIATGKYKTVSQLDSLLAEILHRFLAGAALNTEVGKIGDLQYGGEIHFVAVSPDVLRYDALSQGQPATNISFTRADIQAFAALLGGL